MLTELRLFENVIHISLPVVCMYETKIRKPKSHLVSGKNIYSSIVCILKELPETKEINT
jgi:hypothetical protein